MRRLAILLTTLLAGLGAPGTAAADDADVTAVVTRWSVRIVKPANQLQTKIASATTPDEMLGYLRPFTRVASQGAAAIGAQKSSSAKGAQLRLLATSAFTNYAMAGRLLTSAVNDLKAGKGRSVVEPKIKRAVSLATSGGAKLTKASKLIPQLVGG